MARKYKLKTNLFWRGKSYKAGTVIELEDEVLDRHKIKRLLDKGLLVRETEVEENMTVDMLTDINGVGTAYATRVIEEYGTANTLLDHTAETIADTVGGITVELAEEILDQIRELVD